MRKVLVFSATAALVTLASTAHAGVRYVAADDSPESAVCVSAAADQFHTFNHKLKVNGMPLKVVAAKLDCNGVNVAVFSAQAGNAKVAKTLARYSPSRGEVEIRQAQTEQGAADKVILVKGE